MGKAKVFIPYPLSWDNMPIDMSYIFDKEKPAGKHGFLKVENGEMVFEDGTKGRFWGVGFLGASMFPSFECSRIVARRLAKTGVNIVRFQQMDAEWSTPNLFQFTKGKPLENTLDFDPLSLELLDYFIFCLKQEGIYILIENLSFRKFKSGDGVENSDKLTEGAKPYACFSYKLIELQKRFIHDFWNHVNPFTGLAYKNEPAIACSNINNENGLTCHKKHNLTIEPYRTELEEMFDEWQKLKNYIDIRKGMDFSKPDDRFMDFFIDVEQNYYKEIIDYMHEIGIRIPIAGTNWVKNSGNKKAMLAGEYDEQHGYWGGFWSLWDENKREFDNTPMVTSIDNGISNLVMGRSLDRPFIISEWNDPQPNEWRAESIPYMAAITAFQDWSGIIINAYRYNPAMKDSIMLKDFYSSAIGDYYLREGRLSIYNDPSMFGMFYHSALIYRRGDVKIAKKTQNISIDRIGHYTKIPALLLAGEKHCTGIVLNENNGCSDRIINWDTDPTNTANGEVTSDTGELYRNWSKGYGYINTQRTKVLYGFLEKAGRISLGDMELTVYNDFAVVALSSLTNDPIQSSKHMLLTTVGRAENTGAKYNYEHTELLDYGSMPVTVEVISASLQLRTNAKSFTVWSVNPEGFYQGIIPSRIEDGYLIFDIGKCHKSMYYMIISE